MGLIQLLFGFSGRINRMQYWLGSLGAGFGAGFVLILVTFMAMSASPADPKQAGATAAPMLLLFWGLTLMALSWIGLALQWKRFHDRGRPGWVAFAPILPVMMIFTSVVGGVMSGAQFQQVAAGAQLWLYVLWAINLWFFIDLGCLPSQSGPNQYGDPPGSPRSLTPAPQAPQGAPASAMASLFGAQSAMDRAIAQHQTRPQAATSRPAMALATAAPAPSGAPSFGRRRTS